MHTIALFETGRRSVSLAQRVPPEIWGEIFIRCIPPFTEPDAPTHEFGLPKPSNQDVPLVLLLVCRAWRNVALSTHGLWASLSVVVSLGKACPPLQEATAWINRSGILPLSLSLYQENGGEGNKKATNKILGLFSAYLSRWRQVHLDIADPTHGSLLAPRDQQNPVLLESFHLATYKSPRNEEVRKDLLTLLEWAPKLSSVSVSGLFPLGESPGVILATPWLKQLTQLDLSAVPSVGAGLNLVGACPNLKQCNLAIDTAEDGIPSFHITHTCLSSLELRIEGQQVSSFVDHVVFPGLKDLTLYILNELDAQDSWPQREFAQFLTRSKCSLSQLELHDTGMTTVQFIDCLSHSGLHGLGKLVVDDARDWTWTPFITGQVVRRLTVPIMENGRGNDSDQFGLCLLPSLQVVEMGRNCVNCQDGLISTMVESRWGLAPGIAKLTQVRLGLRMGYFKSMHEEDKSRLSILQDEGLDLILSDYIL